MLKKIFLIDWDDTLFPTSWFNNNLNLYNNETLNTYDLIVESFLTTVIKLGKVYIVTNANYEWINKSRLLLKKTNNILNTIKIYSAKDLYSEKYPNNPVLWKKKCFENIIKHNINYTIITSIGDSYHEKNALIEIYESNLYKNKYFKTINFIQTPTITNLYRQLYLLNKNIELISNKIMHNDIIYM